MKRNLVISSFLTLGLIACGGEETPNENNNTQGDTTSDVVVESCDPGTFGPNCLPVTCVHGTASEGKDGDGKCTSCDSGWSGDNCDQCAGNFTGDNCDQCIDNFAGNNCDQCADNFTGDNCDQCANGYTGANCNKITCVNGTLDSESGTCTSCEGNWDGDNCDQCKANFTGYNCNRCVDSNYWGDNCEKCVNGKTGTVTFKEYSYETICINGKFWMAENLRNSTVDHYSADNNTKNDATYGYLYTWENAKVACPDGWHLPTRDEFQTLTNTSTIGQYENKTLQDKSWVNWADVEKNGFNALPAGNFTQKNFNNFGLSASFWSITTYNSENAFMLYIGKNDAGVQVENLDSALSVRCIKDED